jgi:isocitrate dehydrogenase kinase/phosphatase
MDIENIALQSASAIRAAFVNFHNEFKAITRQAKLRFEERDWAGAQKNATERLDLYKRIVEEIVANSRALLGAHTQNKYIWMKIKKRYSDLIENLNDFELAETFFNSVTRKIFAIAGVDPDIEYVDSDFEKVSPATDTCIYRSYTINENLTETIKKILLDYQFNVPYQNINFDTELVCQQIELELKDTANSLDSIEVVNSIFFRNKGAYIIGRIRAGDQIIPLALPLLNNEEGLYVDAVLLTQNEVSIIFSFTRSYFLVEVECPDELIDFLKSIMPLKPIAELYISIGYNKHGKTELYRDLLRHLESSDDKFEIARGKRGMVMTVFTLPSYDVVFKIIKDKPAFPKTSTRQDVIDKYNLVFKHDRAGRLVDAQEYEHLKFAKDRFSTELLEELQTATANSVTIDGNSVIIKHLYTERKMVPLNLYIKEYPELVAREVIIDYGHAIKEIVCANLFPGDILLKNFGVTRHGRVIFYDYDEICLLTECNFRAIPAARHFDDDFSAEPWFYVGESDIFPEEFKAFLELEGQLKEDFLAVHGDLFQADFWVKTQQEIKDGRFHDIYPYKQSRRLRSCALATTRD